MLNAPMSVTIIGKVLRIITIYRKNTMKIFFITIGFLIFIVSTAHTQEVNSFETRTIPEEVYMQFANLDVNQIIKKIRADHHLKVLILDKTALNYEKNSNLTIGNEEGTSEAIKAYELDEDNQTAIKVLKTPLGEFLKPYFHVHREDGRADRPYLDQPIILLTSSANRMAIVHEFMHYYLFSLEENSSVILDGDRHDKVCGLLLEVEKMRKKTQRLNQEALEKQSSATEKERLQHAELFLDALISYDQMNLEYYSKLIFEEIYIHKLMYENAKALNFNDKEKNISFSGVGRNYLNLYGLLTSISEDPNLNILTDQLSNYSPSLEKKYNSFRIFLSQVTADSNAVYTWYMTEEKK